GADGLILLQMQEEAPGYFMKYYNSDGRQSTFCGNGGRCFISFAKELGVTSGEFCFLGTDGLHSGSLNEDGLIILSMNNVDEVEMIEPNAYVLNTGSPHFVTFVDTVDEVNVFEEGRSIRNSDRFKSDGINVNFIESEGPGKIIIRTYERGVEDETFACGTGVVASAIANAVRYEDYSGVCSVQAKGGDLLVTFDRQGLHDFQNVKLIGPAEEVFEGSAVI
nr:diaminopimelate epimerase [Bacteroidota bacterium]